MDRLTEAQRQALLDRAVEAVRARLAVTPDTDPTDVARRSEVASMAVTDAVTCGGYLHTQIATLAGCTGLQVIRLITDQSAQARAIRVERNAVKLYEQQVRDMAQEHALRRVGVEGYGAISQVAREIGVTRPAVYAWVEAARAERTESD